VLENIEISYALYIKSIAMVQKVSRRPLAADTWVRSLASKVRFVVDGVTVEQDFLQILWSTPVSTIQPTLRTDPFVYYRHCTIIADLNFTLHISELVWKT